MTVGPGREGGCQCGAIRYRLLASPAALYACHCRDCQKQSSSAFGMSMWMKSDEIEFSGADPKIYATRGDSGNAKNCAFCPECGTRLYHQFPPGELLSVKAGTLDDTTDLQPTCHIWTRRAQPWLKPALSEVPIVEGEPVSDEYLTELWHEQCQSRN